MADLADSVALLNKASEVLDAAREARITIALAESCTGGLVSTLLTEIAGASDVFERAYITYSNAAKEQELGVSAELLKRHGAVSEEVAVAMAEGAHARSKAALTLAITGIAGPGGGSEEKPVGTVYIAAYSQTSAFCRQFLLTGDRASIRQQAAGKAMHLLSEQIKLISS